MLAVLITAAFLLSQDKATFTLPVLEGAEAAPYCGETRPGETPGACVTVPGRTAKAVADRYAVWFDQQGYRMVAYPEADAAFVKQGEDELTLDVRVLHVTHVLDGRYPGDDTVYLVFRGVDLDDELVAASEDPAE